MKKRIKLAALVFTVIITASFIVTTNYGVSDAKTQSLNDSSFVVLADPRDGGSTWINALSQIRSMNTGKEPIAAPVEFIVVAGDMDPVTQRYKEYQEVFAKSDFRPLFLPVIGNHDFKAKADFRYIRDILIPSIPKVVRRHDSSCDYYVDHKNVRIIAVDSYTKLGRKGVINNKGKNWVEKIIKETPSDIAHIFVTFHEPAFPRVKHTKSSFNRDPFLRDTFWRMLIKNRDRVRAVFVGHTHYYYRMRVSDPAGKAANDLEAYPDEDGGIYQIDAGAAGHGIKNTIVQVQTKGPNVLFRVLQAEPGENKPFAEIDRWGITCH